MRIVLDENLPKALTRIFGSVHRVATVQELGLAGMANGALLAQLEGHYDVFVTADKNLRYQQNLTGRSLAIVELPTNRLPVLGTMRTEDCRRRHFRRTRFPHPGCSSRPSVNREYFQNDEHCPADRLSCAEIGITFPVGSQLPVVIAHYYPDLLGRLQLKFDRHCCV